jgi:putative two-component system hydrogenase maturation factor HypX/HoxX
MRILLLSHSFNSLTQRVFVDLRAAGYEVSVELDINDEVTKEAVALFGPDLVVALFLKRAIPRAICERRRCLVVHPGPPGDRGPSALDWAILDGQARWGVTVLEATSELDGGPVWAYRTFAMREASKSSLYRHEVTEAAAAAVAEAVEKVEAGAFEPVPAAAIPGARPCWRGAVPPEARRIDWQADEAAAVVRKIASATGSPGVRDELLGRPVLLYDARPALGLAAAPPGTVVARSGPAVARATRDGAVWIGHVRLAGTEGAIKLPATHVFAEEAARLPADDGYRDLWYEEEGGVGFLHFPFHNGAMGSEACRRLLAAYAAALLRPTRVIVLMGGPDHWSNGLDLNLIEAASSPAEESWRNINAIDDLAEAIIRTTDRLVVAAVGANAGAGGVFLARAADEVWVRGGVVLNPHYKDMGNLYGSEFWTYLLPRHAGADNARRITEARLPMGAAEALSLGLADRVIAAPSAQFGTTVRHDARRLAAAAGLDDRLRDKADRRLRDEAERPLSAYRAEELARMRRNFFGFDPSYHVARYNFVHKVPKSRTPLTIARHRQTTPAAAAARRAAS